MAPKKLDFELVTVSTSRYASRAGGTVQADESGDVAEREIARAGHSIVRRELVSDEGEMISDQVKRFLSGDSDVLVFLGGTGVSRRDITIETVRPFFEKEIDGFGELLRWISYRRVGAAAVITRATAGVAGGKLIVCLPGSPRAVSLGLRSLIGEFPHILYVARS